MKRGQCRSRKFTRSPHFRREGFVFGSAWQFPMPEQISDLFKGNSPRQFTDIIASQGQFPLLAVYFGDMRCCRGDPFESPGNVRHGAAFYLTAHLTPP